MEQKLIELKEEMDKLIITGGNFNSPLSVTDRNSIQKNSKDIEKLNNSLINWIRSYSYR